MPPACESLVDPILGRIIITAHEVRDAPLGQYAIHQLRLNFVVQNSNLLKFVQTILLVLKADPGGSSESNSN